jgi:ADP-ribose pyrophosphatase YjhB (NUDIX family)
MTKLQNELHPVQVEILRSLLFSVGLSFSELNKRCGVESNKLTFHLKQLEVARLVAKDGVKYSLTTSGKEYANQLDTQKNKLEKQPKTSVILVIERTNARGEKEYLHQKRLKHPWFGYYVYVTGKVSWGESVFNTAARELNEETGLSGEFDLVAVSHERDIVEDSGNILEDKVFFVMYCKNPTGELIQTEEAENVWISKDDFLSRKTIDGAARLYDYINAERVVFEENEYFFDEADF